MAAISQQELEFVLKMHDQISRNLKQVADTLAGVAKRADEVDKNAKKTVSSLERIVGAAKAAGTALTGAFASRGMLGKTLGVFSQYEKGLINVRKTTDMTAQEMEQFEATFDRLLKTMSGVRPGQMLDIAGVAGQMGIRGADTIAEFSRIMGELSIAAPTVQGEHGAQIISRLLTITREGIQAADTFTDVLVELGNTTAATESEILDLASRIGQATAQFKLGSTAILGLAAAAAELNFRPELFGTAMGRVFIQLNDAVINNTKGMQRLAEMTGITREEFQKMLETHPENALLVFLQVVRDMRDEGQSITNFMRDFNLTGIETLSVVGAASQNLDVFRKKQMDASRARQEDIARTKEYQNAIQGLSAQWDGLVSSATVLTKQLGSALAPAAKAVVEGLRELVNWASEAFAALPDNAKKVVAVMVTLGPAVMGVATALKLLSVLPGMSAILGWGGRAIAMFGTLLKAIFSLKSAAAVFTLLRTVIMGVGAAMYALVGWPGIIVAGIASAAALVISNWEEVKAFFSQSWTEIAKQAWEKITGVFKRIGEYIKGVFADVIDWLKQDDADLRSTLDVDTQPAQQALEDVKKGGHGIIGEITTNIGKGLSEAAKAALDELFDPYEARRKIEAYKKALDELKQLGREAQEDAGYKPEDIAKLEALIKKAERELEPFKVEIEGLDREIERAKAVTKERQNQLDILDRIREYEEANGKLTEEQTRQLTERLKTLQEIEKTNAFEARSRELRRTLEDATALTLERKIELEVLRTIEDTEREIGKLTAERKQQIAEMITLTRQAEAFRGLLDKLDPVGAAIRDYEQNVRTLNEALRQGWIDADRYNFLLQRLNETTLSARNPILERVRTMRQELDLMRLRGRELDVERTAQQEINRLREQGVQITPQLTEAIREYAEALADANQQSKGGIQGWLDAVGTFQDGIAKLQEDAIGGLADAITGFINGTENSFRNFLVRLGQMMVKFAVENTMRELLTPIAQQQKKDSTSRLEQAITNLETIGQSGINTPQAVVNAGSVNINGQDLGNLLSAQTAGNQGASSVPSTSGVNLSSTLGNSMTRLGMGGSLGNITKAASQAVTQVNKAVSSATAAAVDNVTKFIGMHEVTNRGTINSFLKAGGVNIDAAKTAWCAGFVNSALKQIGVTGTGSLIAADFLDWGQAVRPEDVLRGDVLIAHRGRKPGQTGAHVGFATGNTRMGPRGLQLEMLSGNESNRVQTSWYDANQLAIRRATEDMQKLGQTTQMATTQINQQFQQTGMTMQQAGMQVQQGAGQASSAMQMTGTNIQQVAFGTQNAGQYAAEAAPKIDQAASAFQNAGMKAGQAGQQASTAQPGLGGLESGIQGLLAPLNQVIPGLGNFASAILGLVQQLFSGLGGGGGLFGGILGFLFHSGGMVGRTRMTRPMPAFAWAGAPRFHDGLFKKDEYPAILKRGERVLTENQNKRNLALIDGLSRQVEEMGKVIQTSRAGRGRYGDTHQTIVNNINVRDASGFRKSEGQLFADAQLKMQRMAMRNN